MVLSLAPAAASAAVELAPHAAFYTIKLTSVRGGSNVNAVSGEMAIKWDADCAGWTMNHRMIFDVGYVDGSVLRVTMEAATWESRKGDRYDFSVRTMFNDRVTEKLEGYALRSPRHSEAVFTEPEHKVFELPRDVLFPTGHTEAVIAAAQAGRKIMLAKVFDGFTEDGALLVNAVIGKSPAAPMEGEKAFPQLSGEPAWEVQLAFFKENSNALEPESEIGTTLYDNGVARRLEMSFKDFDVRADLVGLDLGTPPACGD